MNVTTTLHMAGFMGAQLAGLMVKLKGKQNRE